MRYLEHGGVSRQQSWDTRWITRDGRIIWGEATLVPRYGEDGRLIAVEGIIRNITDRKTVESSLRTEKERLQLTLEAAGMYIWDWELDADRLAWSPEIPKRFGFDDDIGEVDFTAFMERIHPDDRDGIRQAIHRAIKRKTNLDHEYRILLPDGRPRWLQTWGRVLGDGTGKPVRMIGTVVDITTRKEDEAKLQEAMLHLEQANANLLREVAMRREAEAGLVEAESRFRDLVELALVGIYILRGDRFYYVNPELARVMGVTQTELQSRPVLDFVHPADHALVKENIRKRLSGEALRLKYAFRGLRADGEIREVEVQGTVAEIDGAPAIIGTLLDITEQKRWGEALQTSEERLRLALGAARMGTWDWNLDTDEIVWSEGVHQLFGLPQGYLNGLAQRFFSWVHPADEKGMQQALQEALENETTYAWEFRVCLPTGQVWMAVRGELIRGTAPGKRMLGIIQNTTARKQTEAELREAKELAEESARMKSSILANVSHEIRTPMTSILGFSDILLRELRGQYLERYAQLIQTNGSRLLQMLNNLIEISRLESGEVDLSPVPHPVKDVIAEAVEFFRPLADRKGLSVTMDVPEDLIVATDPSGEKQLMVNLIGNAVRFTEHGSIRIHARPTPDDTTASMAVIVIEDTGVGISETFLPHIFGDFRQESEGHARTYAGAGLGLPLARRLVDRMGGNIHIESKKSRGTTVTLALPLAAQQERNAREGDAAPATESRWQEEGHRADDNRP